MRFRCIVAAAVILSFPSTSHAGLADHTWTEARGPHFRVLTDGGEKDANHVAIEFEQIRGLLASNFPTMRVDAPEALLILAARDENTARGLEPGLWNRKGAKPAGAYHHGWEKQFALVRLDAVAPDAYQVIYHEYVHSFLHANFTWMPVWLDEGLAEFYGYTRFQEKRVVVGAPSPSMAYLQSRTLVPIETILEVDRRSPYYHDEDKVQIFYAESWALVHFLQFGPGMDRGNKLIQFYESLLRGTEQKQAFQQTFGDFKTMQKGLDEYIRRMSLAAYAVEPRTESETPTVRRLTKPEAEAELAGFYVWNHSFTEAHALLEHAIRENPKLAAAHEYMGFLNFIDGRDDDAVREFDQAYALDPQRYLSLFYKTMMSPMARSGTAADEAEFHDAMVKVLQINEQFAPAYVELARLRLRQGNLKDALALARTAERRQPSRAGYHLLSGRILLLMGQGKDAASLARYVADRWFGADHNEAQELWSAVPVSQRGDGPPLVRIEPKEVQTLEGKVRSTTCNVEDKSFVLVLDRDGQILTFRSKTGWSAGFSDTLWYGADHFTLCLHVQGLRAIVMYKPASDAAQSGELVEVELRDDLPAIEQGASNATASTDKR